MLGRLGEKTGGGESSQRRDDATLGNDDVNNTSGGSDGKCSGLISVLHAPSHTYHGPFSSTVLSVYYRVQTVETKPLQNSVCESHLCLPFASVP